jgi:hypothetical protein
MNSELQTNHFFLYPDSPDNPLPPGWHLTLNSNEQIQLSEPVWTKNREVTVSVKGEMSYVIVSAALGPEHPGKKHYRLVRFGPNITFYFNNVMAFLEVKSDDSNKSLSLAIQFFSKLLRRIKNYRENMPPLILFVD